MPNQLTGIARPLAGFSLTLSMLFSGCRDLPPEDPAGMAAFSEYYAGELFLVEKNRLAGEDSLSLRRGLDSLRGRYDLTPGSRDSILAYYRDSLPRWEAFLTGVLRTLDERERALRAPPSDPAAGAGGGDGK